MGLLDLADRTTIVVAVVGTIFAYYLIGSYLNYRKLSQFKGPPLASVTRGYLFWEEIHGRTHKAQHAAIKNYGKKSLIRLRSTTMA
jgi:hypothetical protein